MELILSAVFSATYMVSRSGRLRGPLGIADQSERAWTAHRLLRIEFDLEAFWWPSGRDGLIGAVLVGLGGFVVESQGRYFYISPYISVNLSIYQSLPLSLSFYLSIYHSLSLF